MTSQKLIQRVLVIVQDYIHSYNFLGLVMVVGFFCLSLTPSLLPRPWLMQGVISGIAMAIGYGLGLLMSILIRWFTEAELPAKVKAIAWNIILVVLPIAYIVFIFLGEVWQNQVRLLVGESASAGSHIVRIGLIAFLVFLLLVWLGRVIRSFVGWLMQSIRNFVPPRVSVGLSLLIGTLFVYWIVSGVLLGTAVKIARTIYDKKNATTPVGAAQPTSPYRSGTPESLVPWSTLGYQGQSFVSRGPSQAQLSAFSGSTPKPQIRIYAGLKSSPTPEGRAQLVVREMQRTHAFDRKVIILATTTGTGWLEPQSVDSLEYMYNGDSAIVTQQYSDLPSWISFLVDQDNATEAGQALYNAVYGVWAQLPVETRPKLIAFGLSLGSFGGQAAFSGVNDLTHSIDGALFMGTPSETPLWSAITRDRDPGTPEWQPIYKNGLSVRFSTSNADITANAAAWHSPRVLYLQHGSDPVVWFNFNLPLHQPDWLKEPRAPDVSKQMVWIPIVTFLQVTVDQFYGVTVPNGYGHNYPNTIASAWAAVVPPANWTSAKTDKLQNIINTYPNE